MAVPTSTSYPRLESVISSILTKEEPPLENLHQNGHALDTRLHEWDARLKYLWYDVRSWTDSRTPAGEQYASFRAYLLAKIAGEIAYELETYELILSACQRAMVSSDVPRQYIGRVHDFIARIVPGEIGRRMYLEEWKDYTASQTRGTHTKKQRRALLDKAHAEIEYLRRRCREFKKIGCELEQLVKDLQNMAKQGAVLTGTPAEPRAQRLGGPGAPVKKVAFRNVEVPPISMSRARMPPLH